MGAGKDVFIFFDTGGGVIDGGAVRLSEDFFPSGDEFDFRCFVVIESVDDVDNSFPILLHA